MTLENWKNFESATLYIEPLTILIGTNAAGKSNILDAFMFLQRIASGLSIQVSIEGTTTIEPLRGGLSWVVKKPLSEFSIQLVFEHGGVDYHFRISIALEDSTVQVANESLSVQDFNRRSYWLNRLVGFANTIHYTTLCLTQYQAK